MNAASTMWVTPRGMRKLQQEYSQLKQALRDSTRELREINFSADKDDDGTMVKKLETQVIQARLEEIESMLGKAKTLSFFSRASEAVLGSKVRYSHGDEATRVATLVNSFEADPSEDCISIESPLGKALLGKKAGDATVMSMPAGERELMVVKVS